MVAKVNKTDELSRALEQDQHAPIYLVDADGTATHVVIHVDEARLMFDDYLRREIQCGVDQAARGESEPWDVEATLAEAHRRHIERAKQS